MAPLIVLIAVFGSVLAAFRLLKKEIDWALACRIALAVMLLFTGISHFILTQGMTMMLPGFMPMKREVVLATGVIEVLAAAGLLVKKTTRLTGMLLIVFFICILPANIYAAINKVNLREASYDGPGLANLLFRIPLQVLFIACTYWSAVRNAPPAASRDFVLK